MHILQNTSFKKIMVMSQKQHKKDPGGEPVILDLKVERSLSTPQTKGLSPIIFEL